MSNWLRHIYSLLLLFLLMGTGSAFAGEFCVQNPSPFGVDTDGDGVNDIGIVDGDDQATVDFFVNNNLTQITIDGDCTFRNWPSDVTGAGPLDVTINFQTTDPTIYLITFDNVIYDGNMACANVDHKFWVVNSPLDEFSFKCQELFIPVEAIGKNVPAGKTTVGIGEVFDYTLTIPVLIDPANGGVIINNAGSDNDLHAIVVEDDLSLAALGAALTVQNISATWLSGALAGSPVDMTVSNPDVGNPDLYRFTINPISPPDTTSVAAGDQFQIFITVSVDAPSPGVNQPADQFFNTATWDFGRVIEIDRNDDGIIQPDEIEFFDPLPGENGVSEVLTIGAPNLVVTKTSAATALNIGVPGTFTIDVANSGNTDAWSPTIVDVLPDESFPGPTIAGMCDVSPTSINVGLFEADGTTPAPNQPVLNDDYTLVFDDPAGDNCTLTLAIDSTGTNNIVIEPGQRLIITYDAQLDGDTTADGVTLTNIAAATEWFSANPGGTPAFITFNPGLIDPDPAIAGDNQDDHDVITGLSGYFFTKTVENLETGEFPATTAVPGDTLRYSLRIFNVDQAIDNIQIEDVLDAATLNVGTYTSQPGLSTGVTSSNLVGNTLTVTGNNLANLGDELLFVFDIDVAGGLANGTIVSNQASLTATGVVDPIPGGPVAFSDDPFLNGIDDPLTDDPVLAPDGVEDADPTEISILQPGPLLKVNDDPNTLPVDPVTEATIGEEVVYTITVPEVPVPNPLYDVRILDNLSAGGADLEFVSASVVSGGAWTLTNTGTSSIVLLEDTGAGIDIPGGGQAVIELRVRIANTTNNQIGDTFTNTATYTYNRVNNDAGSVVFGSPDSTAVSTTITEPEITTINKTPSIPSPTAGEIVRYSITLTAAGGGNFRDVFDVTLTDTLDLGLVYATAALGGTPPTVTIGAAGGSGVADDNTIGEPDVTGDGVATQQILDWTAVNSNIDIDAGETITIEYDVLVLDSVLANQTLNNSVIAQWTGIDGANLFERSGIDGGPSSDNTLLNNYAIGPAVAPLTIVDIVTTIDKVRSSDTFNNTGNVRVGDIVEYTLTIPMPEGTLGNLTLVDTLPTGLAFEGVVSVNFDTTGGDDYTPPVVPPGDNFSYAAITPASLPVAGQTGAVTWNLGNINNLPQDDLPNDFVIVYTARVQNGDVLTQQDNTPLQNSVNMIYDTATSVGAVIDNDVENIAALQPNLSITKTAAPQFGDIFIVAGETVTYTVDVTNDGTAPAYDPVIQDIIPDGLRTAGVTVNSITLIGPAEDPADILPAISGASSEIATWNFDDGVTADTYTIDPNQTLQIVYTVTADSPIAIGLTMTNVASVENYYSLDDDVVSPTNPSTTREVYPDPLPVVTDSTTVYTANVPTKALNTAATATIGEIVEYTLTVPGVVATSDIFDIQVTDLLDANLELVSVNVAANPGVINVVDASIDNVAPAQDQVVLNIDQINAGSQAVITLQARVRNVASAQEVPATPIDNAVSYTYAFTDGGLQQPALVSTDIVTVNVVEPDLTATKIVTPITPAPITGGDIMQYTVTITNNGSSTAFDTNIVDTLPAGLTLDAGFAPTINLNGGGAVNNVPSGGPAGPLVWGRDNADDTLDILPGNTLVLVYRVLIDASAEANVTLTNDVQIDWSSLDGVDVNERDGAGCPLIAAPDDYCSAAFVDIVTDDTNNIDKVITADSFAPDDGQIRVGDTVTYTLSLNLQEGTTRSVAVDDVLDAGLEFVGIVSINGDTTPDYIAPGVGAGSNFSYAPITAAALPAAGATGTLTFTIGDVVNDPLGDATTDTLTIVYTATVAPTIVQAASTPFNNNATLNYLDGLNAPQSDVEPAVTATVLQPVMADPVKVDAVFTSGDVVDPANDTMQFTVESCNNGLAPAYDLVLIDNLPTQLDENTLLTPVVQIYDAPLPGGVLQSTLTEGVANDFVYSAPAGRGGDIIIDMSATPVNPGECLRVSYNIGFYTDFGAGQIWNNSVTVNEYWSLPAATGQEYGPSAPATFTMTNGGVPIISATKLMTTPVSAEATVGEPVIYQITLPEAPITSAIFDIDVTDTLNASLVLESITVVDNNTNPLAFTDNTVGNNVDLRIAQIPAGQQAIITLTTRVDNNASANGGVNFDNTINYTFETAPGGVDDFPGISNTTPNSLLIVEPNLAIGKSVANTSTPLPTDPPGAGDVLQYTVTLTADGGAPGDNFSDAFDINVVDTLSAGLTYQVGSASVTGGSIINDPAIVGDGSIATPQELTWQVSDATANIDIPEGGTVDITYNVIVLDTVVAGQNLTNSAVAQWTGLNDGDPNEAFERDGSLSIPENDYVTIPATTLVTVPDVTLLQKSILSDTSPALTAPTDVRVGDIIEYEIRVTLAEGVTTGVEITDTLPPGMAFESFNINGDTAAPFTSVAPFTHVDINPSVVANTVTFTIGDITNAGDNNPANDDFVILYYARVLDNTPYPQPPALDPTLSNNAVLNYTVLGAPTNQTVSVDATLRQPFLEVAKINDDPNGNGEVNADDVVVYTVTVSNAQGTAPAYDVVVEDIIPVGMRNGTATITPVSTTVNGAGVANVVPAYDPGTGLATWNFDNGATPDTYTIQPGQDLVIVYTVQADADLGPGLLLENAATATLYYSFDDDTTPNLGGVTGVAEIYGPSNTAITTLTSPIPGPLLKQAPSDLGGATTVAIGETFIYRITVPDVAENVALTNVQITDDLSSLVDGADGVNLELVSITPVGGPYPWTAQNTSGDPSNLLIQDPAIGIDIPAGQQIVLDLEVVVTDTAINVGGDTFTNTANYSYTGMVVPPADGVSGAMTIVEPNNLIMTKTASAPTIRVGTPVTYTMDLLNDNTSGFSAPAWDITITDVLPDFEPAAGGMCTDIPPVITSVEIYDVAGPALLQTLNAPADYTSNFDVASCTLTITTTGALQPDNFLRVVYDANLDADTPPNSQLYNIAGATQWFSTDDGIAPTRTFTPPLSIDPLVAAANPDHEDSELVTSEVPEYEVRKTVELAGAPGVPITNASPGDTLHYIIEVDNQGLVTVPNFTFIDDLDALNATPMFVPGTLVITNNGGGVDNSDPNGGINSTGLVNISGLSLVADPNPGLGNIEVTIEFDVQLVPVITSGTDVLNQGLVDADIDRMTDTDLLVGDPDDPTPVTIVSAPQFEVQKTSADITGDPFLLLSGDTLRYTLTVRNIGNEDAVNATLLDALPANTTYVPGSTTLNGVVVPDGGTLPLIGGILINAPADPTPGALPADDPVTPDPNNIATITFDVTVNGNVVDGTIISNQGFLNADGAGTSGPVPQTPSDDPTTPTLNDPTIDVVGAVPLVDATKTVVMLNDVLGNGILDPGDTLLYTITVTNFGAAPATGVTLQDNVPNDTTYFADSTTLNTIAVGVPDGGVSPLIAGIVINGPADLPGVLAPGAAAVVEFVVTVNDGVVNAPGAAATPGTLITNQGIVDTDQAPAELTDSDGNDTNGDQPTVIVVGDTQTLSIVKSVAVVGGGPALAGNEIEYTITVTNIGTIPADTAMVTDNLDLPVGGQLIYTSALLNGLPAGISFNPVPQIVTADYGGTYGDLPSGASFNVTIRAQIEPTLAIGTTIANTADVTWDNLTPQNASASVAFDVGGTPGLANIGGTLWHDANYDNVNDPGETLLAGWTVELYFNTSLLATTTSDTNGQYTFNGLLANDVGTDIYEVRFFAPGAGPGTAMLGEADSPFTDDLQLVTDIIVSYGSNIQTLNLPIDPNGVVYNSILRTPLAGVTLTMVNTTNGLTLPTNCFDDPAQQNQVTGSAGYYKFDLNFSQVGICDSGDDYYIQINGVPTDFTNGISVAVPPTTDLANPAYDVLACAGDQNITTPERCEVLASELAPVVGTPGTPYHLHYSLTNSLNPFAQQIFNNHIPIDPERLDAFALSKTSPLVTATRGQMVPYTITLTNKLPLPLTAIRVVDTMPPGFKYVEGSARITYEAGGITNVSIESDPVNNGALSVVNRNMTWDQPLAGPLSSIAIDSSVTIKMLLVIGSGVGEGEYVNTVQAFDTLLNIPLSGVASATVRVIPDPIFDCSDVIGKVYDDINLNNYQDEHERGIAGVRVLTARGLQATTDEGGRFHITCAVTPELERGSNFILKVDDRSLPSGYRILTENPRVQRLTAGKMTKFNFGAALHRVIKLDIADGVFEPGTAEMRPQWKPRLTLLLEMLTEKASILRLAYMADTEDEDLVEDRIEAVKDEIEERWEELDCCYKLNIETELFWRTGGPTDRGAFK